MTCSTWFTQVASGRGANSGGVVLNRLRCDLRQLLLHNRPIFYRLPLLFNVHVEVHCNHFEWRQLSATFVELYSEYPLVINQSQSTYKPLLNALVNQGRMRQSFLHNKKHQTATFYFSDGSKLNDCVCYTEENV